MNNVKKCLKRQTLPIVEPFSFEKTLWDKTVDAILLLMFGAAVGFSYVTATCAKTQSQQERITELGKIQLNQLIENLDGELYGNRLH